MSDLISRQKVMIILNDCAVKSNMKGRVALLHARNMIHELPSVEPERKPCYWTHDKDGWKCGACHNTIRDDDFPTCMGAPIYNYCPLCGEDMRGV